VAVVVTVQAAILSAPSQRASQGAELGRTDHGLGILVGSCLGIPLGRHLSRRTCIRTVVARLAMLVGTHGPPCILLPWSHGDESRIVREGALSSTPLHAQVFRSQFQRVVSRLCYRRVRFSALLVLSLQHREMCVAMFGICNGCQDPEQDAQARRQDSGPHVLRRDLSSARCWRRRDAIR
jgi:hypothetical protein